jgi:hypothetical protein
MSPSSVFRIVGFTNYRVPDAPRVGTWAAWMWRGGASPFDLPERVALDATASLARRVGASAVLRHREHFPFSIR